METLLKTVSRLVEQVTGDAPHRTSASAPRALPIVKVLVLGADGAGKTTLIRTFCDRRKQSGQSIERTSEIFTSSVTLEQRERKWLPLTAEYALRSGQEHSQSKGYWKKGEGLRFELQLCEVPMSELHDETGTVQSAFSSSHAAIFVVDSMRPLTVRGAMRWASVCDRLCSGRMIPRALAVHKIDAGRTLIPSEAIEGLTQTCGALFCSKTSTAGLSVADFVHRLLDEVLELEVERMGTDSCQVDWLVGHRQNATDVQSLSAVSGSPLEEASIDLSCFGELHSLVRESGELAPEEAMPRESRQLSCYIPEMYYVNEKKPASMSSTEESDLSGWPGNAASPDGARSSVQSSAAREQRRQLKRIMKSIVKYYENLQVQLERICQQTGEDRAKEFDHLARRRTTEYKQLLNLLTQCSQSSDESSGSSSSGAHPDVTSGEPASLEELTAMMVSNQLKWSRLLEAYETELALSEVAEERPGSLSPRQQLVGRRATLAAGERSRDSPKGFSFRHRAEAPAVLTVNHGSAPLILRTRCESL